MRKSYPGYTQPTDRELKRLWTECVFTFDASALLDLYRLTPETRDAVLKILDRLKDRIWLPHQAGLEYQDNRVQVIATGLDSYSRVPELAREIAETYRRKLDIYRQYRWIQADRWAGLLEEAVKKIEVTISKENQVLGGFPEKDPIEEKLNEIFDGNVGSPYKDMHDIYVRAEQRLQLSIPPGFKDASLKKDFHRYGDVVLWFQILDYAKAQKKSIVFVTSDAKTDWWLVRDRKTVGPRPELVEEMHAVADVSFYMYSPDRFVGYAEQHLKSNVKSAILKRTAQELRAVEAEKSAEMAHRIGEYLHNLVTVKPQFDVHLMSEYLKDVKPQLDLSAMSEYLKDVKPQLDLRVMSEYLKDVKPRLDLSVMSEYLRDAKPQPDFSLMSEYLKGMEPQIDLSPMSPASATIPRVSDEKSQQNTPTAHANPASEGEQDTPRLGAPESPEEGKRD